jgi:hypothetical protein
MILDQVTSYPLTRTTSDPSATGTLSDFALDKNGVDDPGGEGLD